MKLIAEMEAFAHALVQAIERAAGNENATVKADVVVSHLRDVAKEDDDTNQITESVQKSPEAAQGSLYYNPETKVVFASVDAQTDPVKGITPADVDALVADGATVDSSAEPLLHKDEQ